MWWVYRVFVSHASQDTAAAAAVTRWLTDNEPSLTGQIFLDVDPQTGIAPGVRWKSELVRAVGRCEAVICLISPAWDASPECQAEFRLAESLNKRVFCARLDPAARGEKVREWQVCDLFPEDGFAVIALDSAGGPSVEFAADGLARLLRGLRAAGIGAEFFPWPPDNEPHRAPYRGWQPMEPTDAAVFFGRDAQILRGLDTLRGMRATGVEGLFVILGPSGVGKSSFLRAGLLPRLQRDRNDFLVCDIVRPERAALTGDHGLAQAIWRLRSRAGPGGPELGEVKVACLDGNADRLVGWLRDARREAARDAAGPPAPTLVLPIDQGEELFAVGAGPQAGTCLELLGSMLQSGAMEELPLIAAMTIRADRYEALQNAPALLAVHAREFGELKPMPLTEYKDVITGPAARASAAGLRLSLEPQLVARLLADATGGADSLPLLALTLSRLYLDYGGTGRLTLASYQAMGGMQRIVEAEIDTLLAADPTSRAHQLDVLRTAFIPWLATIDPDTDAPSRRVARWTELPPASHELIDAMVTRRLLVKDEREGQTVVEVALESLLRQWDSLAGWLGEQATGLKMAHSLESAAAEWERNQLNPEWLIEGARLTAAEELARSPIFGERVSHAAEFLAAARARENAQTAAENQRREDELRIAQERRDEAEAHATTLRKRARVLRAVMALTLVVAVAAAAGFVLMFRARGEAERGRAVAESLSRDAIAERLITQAQSMMVGAQPGSELEMLAKLIAAHRISSNVDKGALLTALDGAGRLRRLIDGGGDLSADGRLVTRTDSGYQVGDAETGQPAGRPFADPKTSGIAGLSVDGRYVATFTYDESAIRVWDSSTGQPIGRPLSDSANVSTTWGVAVTSDGRRVAAIDHPDDDNDSVRIWDTATGEQSGAPITEAVKFVNDLAFSRDGRRLAASGAGGVQVWDADTHAVVMAPSAGVASDWTGSVAFSPDGRTIAAGGYGFSPAGGMARSEGPALRLWNAESGAPVGASQDHGYGFVKVAFSPDGGRVATAGGRTLDVWDARTGEQIGDPAGLLQPASGVAFTKGGDRILVVSGRTLLVYDADPDAGLVRELASTRAARLDGHQWQEFRLDDPPAGQRVIAVRDGTLRWLDLDTGDEMRPAVASDQLREFQRLAVSPDDRWIAVVGDDDSIRIIDVNTGRSQGAPIAEHRDVVNSIAFSPDGTRLASASGDGTVRVWEPQTGRQIVGPLTGHEYPPRSVAFSTDGRRLYSTSVDSVRIWDTTDGHPLGKPADGGDPTVLTADGRRFATGSSFIRQFDSETGEPVGSVVETPISEMVWRIAYSTDGRYLASVSTGWTLRLWDVASGRQIGAPVHLPFRALADDVRFSRDDRRIFVGGADGVWSLPGPAGWADALCDKLAANPSPAQWTEWITADLPYRELCPGKPQS